MKYKHSFLAFASLLFFQVGFSQSSQSFKKNYRFLHSGNYVADKNFYLLTVLDSTPDIFKLLSADKDLKSVSDAKVQFLLKRATDTTSNLDSLVDAFVWRGDDSTASIQALERLYRDNQSKFDKFIDGHLRPSGYFQRFAAESNAELLLDAWRQSMLGMNYIMYQYGLGRKMRYPSVDSASFYVHSDYYRTLVKSLLGVLNEKDWNGASFYKLTLTVAIRLMEINDRREPALFEPLEKGENKLAYQKVPVINWANYKYSAILVPGEGPELVGQSISPAGRLRCEMAAERYKKGMAPFIIVSGGFVHPFHTMFNEAFEMKKYLMAYFQIPEYAIIIEPQARHTTTNFRNANRLMIRYGFPVEKEALCVTTIEQSKYIQDNRFDQRNLKELGYLPYKNKNAISIHESSYLLVLESLHMDPFDPLDP